MDGEIYFEKYKNENFKDWNSFLELSNNGTFLHNRRYIEYHGDRYIDHSYLIKRNGKIIGLLPCASHDLELISHPGLTYGGLILLRGIHSLDVISIFKQLVAEGKSIGFKNIIYKSIPFIYSKYPTDCDHFALHILGAKLVRRQLSACIYLKEEIKLSKGRKSSLSKAKKSSVVVGESNDIPAFMNMLQILLWQKHKTRPTHTVNEICKLSKLFPEHIRLVAAFHQNQIIAGVLFYLTNNVCRAQYIASTAKGREISAVDICIDFALNEYCVDRTWFDFGTSSLIDGQNIDESLMSYKESWGARGITADQYLLKF